MEKTQEQIEQLAPSLRFDRDWLRNFSVIHEPGKYKLKVYSTVTRSEVFNDEQTGLKNYNIMFRAIPAANVGAIKKLFAEGTEVPAAEVKKLMLGATAYVNPNSEVLPLKGETADVVIDYVGNELKLVSLRLQEAMMPERFNYNQLFGTGPDEKAAIVASAISENETVLKHD